MRRVVVVAEFVDAARNSTGYYWHKILRGLLESGWSVAVVSTPQSCRLAQPLTGAVSWHPVPDEATYRKDGTLARLVGQLRLTASLALATWRQLEREDVLFCGTNPPFLLLALAVMRQLRRFRWVVLVHDVFPENALATGLIRERSWSYRLAKLIFDRTYGGADALVAIGRDMVDTLHRKAGLRTAVHYVPNWVDSQEIEYGVSARIRPTLEPRPGQVLFQFFGNFGRVQGLDTLLEAIGHVRNPRAAFVFIGDGAMADRVRAAAVSAPGRITLLSPLPFTRNNEGLLACDVAMITLSPGMLGLAVPSKAYFSLAADKPILVVGDEGAELAQMLREHPEVGWHCKAGDPKVLAETIDRICGEDLAARLGSPRRLAETLYDCRQAVPAYCAILGGDVPPAPGETGR